MFDPELSNKKNPILAGLTGLGEGLFQGFITRKKMDEESRQFNEKLAFEERQNSLLWDFRQKQAELEAGDRAFNRANTLADNQARDFTAKMKVAEDYDIENASDYLPYATGTKPLPQTAISLEGNSLLGGKVGIRKPVEPKERAAQFQTGQGGRIGVWNPETKSFDPTNWTKEKEPNPLAQVSAEIKDINLKLAKNELQTIEDKKAQSINDTQSLVDSYISAKQKAGDIDKSGNPVLDYAITNEKGMTQHISPEQWKVNAKRNINKLLLTKGLATTKNSILNQAKAQTNFAKLTPQQKQSALKQILDKQDIPEEDKIDLYRWVEIESRL